MSKLNFFPTFKEGDVNKNNNDNGHLEHTETLAVISSHAFTFLGIAISIGLLCRPLLKLAATFLPFICAYHVIPQENSKSPNPK